MCECGGVVVLGMRSSLVFKFDCILKGVPPPPPPSNPNAHLHAHAPPRTRTRHQARYIPVNNTQTHTLRMKSSHLSTKIFVQIDDTVYEHRLHPTNTSTASASWSVRSWIQTRVGESDMGEG